MAEIWSVSEETSKVLVGSETVEVEGEITVEKIIEIAKKYGIKKFTVEREGDVLSQADFPVSGTVVLKEYNEAK